MRDLLVRDKPVLSRAGSESVHGLAPERGDDNFAGIDVARAQLALGFQPAGERLSFTDDRAGRAALVR